MNELPPRHAIAQEYTWDAGSVFATETEWENALRQATENLSEFAHFIGKLQDGPERLLEWFALWEAQAQKVEKVALYAGMFHTVDTTDSTATDRYGRASGLYARFAAATAFAEPEILALGQETVRRWMQESSALAPYAHYFDQLFRRAAHTRSAEVETLLGQVAEPLGTARRIHGTLADADLTFAPATSSNGQTYEVGQGSIGSLLTDADRETRRTAWENYADAFLAYKNTAATCLTAGIQRDVFIARARNYPSSLEASLSPNSIPTSVFHNLLATFRANLPTWHRYWEVRRRALGGDTLHVYDIKAPLIAQSPVVPYSQSVEWIAQGMEPLGEKYVSALKRGSLEQRWVDIYPNRGKRMGAFSSGAPGTHPFILMSYHDDLFSLSTLAHELGHSLHSYHTWQTQPFVYADYSLFVAEVASNFNQALVRAYLMRTQTDRDFQIALIEEAMSNFHRYFFIMPTLARFELEIHERVERGEALTAQSLNTLMADLFAEGYGDGVVKDRERIGITWAQFPTHLYSNFYVYQYATGIAAAHALAEGVLSGKEGATERYLDFLSCGGSRYPLDALKMAGVDMTQPEPVESAFAVFAQMVERLAELLGVS